MTMVAAAHADIRKASILAQQSAGCRYQSAETARPSTMLKLVLMPRARYGGVGAVARMAQPSSVPKNQYSTGR